MTPKNGTVAQVKGDRAEIGWQAQTRAKFSTDPPTLVTQVPLEMLMDARSAINPVFGRVPDGDRFRYICPRCAYVDHNGGRAYAETEYAWRCGHCRFHGTRYVFEQAILESVDLIMALVEVLNESEVTR